MFFDHGKKMQKTFQSVELCNIYKYKQLCFYWLFRFREKNSDLRLGVAGNYKHLDKKYDNVLGFGIPDMLMNLLSCQGFFEEQLICCHNQMS